MGDIPLAVLPRRGAVEPGGDDVLQGPEPVGLVRALEIDPALVWGVGFRVQGLGLRV